MYAVRNHNKLMIYLFAGQTSDCKALEDRDHILIDLSITASTKSNTE